MFQSLQPILQPSPFEGIFDAPQRGRRRKARRTTTAEETSALRKIGQIGLSGITTASAMEDVAGGAIRNLLVGQAPGTDPFSFEGRASGRDVLEHWLPIPKNIEGFHPIKHPMDALLDVAGFATEVGLDPWTYFSLGGSAVSKAGKAFKKAGLMDFLPEAARKAGQGRMAGRMGQTPRSVIESLPKDIRGSAFKKFAGVEKHYSKAAAGELLDMPIGGAATFWPTGTALGKAGGFGGTIAKHLDPVGEAIRYGKYSPIRGGYAAFSPALQGQADAAMQGQADAAMQRTLKFQAAKNAFKEMEIKQKWHLRVADAAARGHIGDGPDAIKHARKDRMFGEGIEGVRLDDPHMEKMMDDIIAEGEEILAHDNYMGLPTEKLKDYINYLKRGRTPFGYSLVPGARGGAGTMHPSMIPRKDVLKGSPQGTELYNRLSLDLKIAGIASAKHIGPKMSKATRLRLEADLMAAKGITAKKAKELVRAEFPLTSSKAVDLDAAVAHIYAEYGDVLPEGFTQADVYQLAETVSLWDRRHPLTGTPIFAHHPIIDSMERELLSQKATGNAEAIYDLLGQFVKRRQDMLPDEGRISLAEALKSANLTGSGAHARMKEKLPKGLWKQTEDSIAEMGRRLGIEDVRDLTPQQQENLWGRIFPDAVTAKEGGLPGMGKGISSETILSDLYVPKDIADNIIGVGKMFTTQDAPRTIMHQMGEFYDSWLNLFRGHVTAYWPAFINRNLMSGQIQNAIGGAYGINIFGRSGMSASMKDALYAMWGKNMPDVLDIPLVREAGITDPAEATRFVMTRLSGGGLGGYRQTEFASHLSREAVATAKDIMGEIPGTHPWTMRETAGMLIPGTRKGKRPGWLNPLKLRGVGGEKETEFFLSQFGGEMGWAVETLNRFAPAISMLRRGIDPMEAVKRVKLLQVDYMAQAAGDKVMRRLVPFFSFLKGQSKYLAQELTQKPGGALAQTIRAEALLQREGVPAIIPDYLQQSANIPIGESAAGDPRILTSLGLMHEDPLQLLGGKKGGPLKTVGSMALTAGREMLGRATPAAKAVIEPLLGVSTWQYGPRGGRNVEDMYGYLGGLTSQAASKATGKEVKVKLPAWAENIPQVVGAGRYFSTAGQLLRTDRSPWAKALGVGTGMKTTVIEPWRQDKVIKENIEEQMGELGARQYTDMYFPKRYMEKLSPEQQQKRRELVALKNALERRQKERTGR